MFGFSDGISAYIVSSSTYADMLIKEFDRRMMMGYNPNDVCDEVFEKIGISSSDLTSEDYNRVQRAVEQLWEMYN